MDAGQRKVTGGHFLGSDSEWSPSKIPDRSEGIRIVFGGPSFCPVSLVCGRLR